MLSAPSRRGKMPELAIRSVWWSMLGKGTPLLPKKSQEIPNLSSFSQEPPMLVFICKSSSPSSFIKTNPREGGMGLRNIFHYCTGAMSRVRLIGLITAVCTPFGLDTSINQIRIASTRCYPRRAGGERCRSWLLGAFGGPCWGKELLFCPKSPKKSQI